MLECVPAVIGRKAEHVLDRVPVWCTAKKWPTFLTLKTQVKPEVQSSQCRPLGPDALNCRDSWLKVHKGRNLCISCLTYKASHVLGPLFVNSSHFGVLCMFTSINHVFTFSCEWMSYSLRSAAKKKHNFTEYKCETFTGEAEKRKNEFWVISDLMPQADEKLLKAQNKWRQQLLKRRVFHDWNKRDNEVRI